MEMIDLALTYGGFTALDRVYLEGVFKDQTRAEQLRYITPPPSVLNAYFAELYQKKGPLAATDYYFSLSRDLELFQPNPSFQEEKPFVRLNLSGKAFGFAYRNEKEEAIVFGQEPTSITVDLLFHIAQIFPHYLVFQEKDRIVLLPSFIEEENWQVYECEDYLLTSISQSDSWYRLQGVNQEEVCLAASKLSVKGPHYLAWSGKQAILYCHK